MSNYFSIEMDGIEEATVIGKGWEKTTTEELRNYLVNDYPEHFYTLSAKDIGYESYKYNKNKFINRVKNANQIKAVLKKN